MNTITALERGLIGFDAGDQNTGDTVSHGDKQFALNDVNIFRIDGK